jgi:beta-glucanase (GH16 family)
MECEVVSPTKASQMPCILSAPTGFSVSDLVFEDCFSGASLNASNWNTYVTSAAAHGWPWGRRANGGSGMGNTINDDYFMPSQVTVNNGLSLTAIKQSVTGITNNSTGAIGTFTYTSGVVSSYGKLDFIGGYLQISMKEPSGSGSWPGLWLVPGKGATNGDNFEIDIQEGGFTNGVSDPNRNFAWHLHGPNGWSGGVIDTGVDLTAGYHSYAINWVPGKSITWYLDGKQMVQVSSAQAPIPSEPMELMMNQSVGNTDTSGWRTPAASSTPRTMSMQIADVQLYQRPYLGESAARGK